MRLYITGLRPHGDNFTPELVKYDNGHVLMESSYMEKDFGLLVDSRLSMG